MTKARVSMLPAMRAAGGAHGFVMAIALVVAGCTNDFDALSSGEGPQPAAETGGDSTIGDASIDVGTDGSATETSADTNADTGATSDTATIDTGTLADTAPTDTGTADTAVADTAKDAPAETPVTCSDPGGLVFAGHCYFPTGTSKNWNASKTICAAAGAHLVSIGSAPEQSFVEAINPGKDRWIGLIAVPSGSSTFTWVDATPFSYTHWAPTEPNGTDDCVRLTGGGPWGDQNCGNAYPAICERP